jgi:hypothetical protein
MNYTGLSLREVTSALEDIARDANTTFGRLNTRQLNWRPDATRWSVAQCFQHLVTANRLMLDAAKDALENPSRSVWQRVPLLPSAFGWVMIRSQAPETTRKFTAPTKAQPTTSDLPGDIVPRFVDQHRDVVEWMQSLDERKAKRTIMVSPFVRAVTYSVLDGLRLLFAHDRRHFEQARRVMQSNEFPRSSRNSPNTARA